ncbi:MAG: hypothetical protein OXF09_05525 [Hyphomicrobiales bacterium]|nr:hypothetical protein [Hyphomicrobiales bacterium]
MPNQQGVLKEISEVQEKGHPSPADFVRGKYLNQLSEYTERNVIAYYSGFLSDPHSHDAAINEDDKNGFMFCCHGLDRTKGLDLILHTSGGDLQAMASLVTYLKEVFGNDIRAIIPQIAMSAGTMMAVACKSIVMGKQSSLGPTDPWVNGHPAYAVKKQFEQAHEEITENPNTALVWQPILRNLGASFLKQCDWAIQYAENFVTEALKANMLKEHPEATAKSKEIAETLGDLERNKSHGRRFHYMDCKNMGLEIEMLEDKQELQDLVLSVHHCYMHAMGTKDSVMKVIENHKENIWGKQSSSS